MDRTKELSLEFIRSVVCGADAVKLSDISADELRAIYELTCEQDMAHIVGFALEEATLPPECEKIKEAFSNQYLMAICRFQRLNYEYKRICSVLENNKIKYLPLKGSVIRPLYPKEWMRTSCDIDILVEECNLKSACDALASELNYKVEDKCGYHDVSLYAPSGIHLELHFNIRENSEDMDAVLDRVWDYSYLYNGEYGYKETDEFLAFHLIAHAAYHFKSGGCGFRPVLDIWLLRRNLKYDSEVLNILLRDADLSDFAAGLFVLSDVWYSGTKHSDLTRKMEKFVLGANVYGNIENRIAVSIGAKRGRIRYILHRVFLPYRDMKTHYPVLEKCPLLLPFCEVHRWFAILFSDRRKRAVRELKQSVSITNEKRDEVVFLMDALGLK